MKKGPAPTTYRTPSQGGREIRARVSAEEYARVEVRARAAGMEVPEFVRMMALSVPVPGHLVTIQEST